MLLATPLHVVLAEAGLALAPVPHARRDPRAPDPLAIDLPPVLGARLPAEVVAAVASTYLFAEVDLGGVLPAAEAIVEARADLTLRDDRALEAIERFALDAHAFPSRADREKLYARLFGMGGRAALDSSGYHAFLSDFAAMCVELVRLSQPGMQDTSALTFASVRLIAGFAAHGSGDVVWRARRLHAMLVRAIAMLDMPALGAALGVHGVSAVVHAVMADGAPDLGSAERRGHAGQRLIAACASGSLDPHSPDLALHASTWLVESEAVRAERSSAAPPETQAAPRETQEAAA
jgi:hypothetical protein